MTNEQTETVRKITDEEWIAQIKRMNEEVSELENNWCDLKAATKVAKDAFDEADQQLRQAISDANLPLFDDDKDK